MPRTREEIEKENNNPRWANRDILEVVLDIRDILLHPKQSEEECPCDEIIGGRCYKCDKPQEEKCAYYPGECRDVNCPKHKRKEYPKCPQCESFWGCTCRIPKPVEKELPPLSEDRMERLEVAILDVALAVQEGRWDGVYQDVAQTLHPLGDKK